jgi:agmatine deiminase
MLRIATDESLSPAADGYRMPAEWEEHSRSWMLWPFRSDVWRESARPAQKAFAEVAAAIARFEPVTVGALPALLEEARQMLPSAVEVVPLEYNDAWVRDTGPTFLVDDREGLAGVDWPFNAWGGHYADFAADDALPQTILQRADAKPYRADLIMEGGALHTDGEGTLLVVEECLLHPSRNPHLSKGAIEERLKRYLNVQWTTWPVLCGLASSLSPGPTTKAIPNTPAPWPRSRHSSPAGTRRDDGWRSTASTSPARSL